MTKDEIFQVLLEASKRTTIKCEINIENGLISGPLYSLAILAEAVYDALEEEKKNG